LHAAKTGMILQFDHLLAGLSKQSNPIKRTDGKRYDNTWLQITILLSTQQLNG